MQSSSVRAPSVSEYLPRGHLPEHSPTAPASSSYLPRGHSLHSRRAVPNSAPYSMGRNLPRGHVVQSTPAGVVYSQRSLDAPKARPATRRSAAFLRRPLQAPPIVLGQHLPGKRRLLRSETRRGNGLVPMSGRWECVLTRTRGAATPGPWERHSAQIRCSLVFASVLLVLAARGSLASVPNLQSSRVSASIAFTSVCGFHS